MTRTVTILVVDDEQLIRWALSERFRSEECAVVEAATGRQALAVADQPIDLALLDYRLPDIDGVTLLRLLKQRHPHLIAMMVTACPTDEIRAQAQQAGAFHLLEKPFDLEQITRLVRAALEGANRRTS